MTQSDDNTPKAPLPPAPSEPRLDDEPTPEPYPPLRPQDLFSLDPDLIDPDDRGIMDEDEEKKD
jgi:hypothetical protein